MLPDPLPPRFTARLAVSVRSVIRHPVLKGGRQQVDAGPLEVQAEVDRGAGTVQITDFPTVSDRVATKLGRIKASVELVGQPEGTFDDATGHIAIRSELHIAPKSMLARDSDVTMTLSSDDRVETPEVSAEGDPLDDGDDVVRLVGEGPFRGGTLAGGTFWLVLDCTVESVEEL